MKIADLKSKFYKKSTYLFDLDGTLYLGTKILPGALQLINRLKNEKKKVFFFTNNSSFSDRDYFKKLKKMGFPVRADQIIVSTHSLIRGLQKDRVKKLFVLGTPAMKSMLKRSKLQVFARPDSTQAIVVGFDKTLTYEKLEMACFAIARGKPWYAAHPDLFCPTENGPQPDCGAFSKAIELITKASPRAVFGKPHPLMIQEAARRSNSRRSEMVLVGDRLMTDILMANRAGIDSIHVQSGDSTQAELKRFHGKCLGSVSGVKALL